MKKTLNQSLSETLSLYYPYSVEAIYDKLKIYNSVDLVMDGLDDSLELNISLEQACYRLRKQDENNC